MSYTETLNLQGVTNKEVRELLKEVSRTPGWKMEKRGSGHILIRGPKGMTVTSSMTPRGFRAVSNLRAQLKRAGWQRPEKKKEKEMQTINGSRAEEVEHPEVEGVIGLMLPNGARGMVPDFGFGWEFVDSVPESMANKVQHPKEKEVTSVDDDIARVDANRVRRGATKAMLQELTLDDLEDAEPPRRVPLSKQRMDENLETLLLDLVTDHPGKWKKIGKPMTTTAQKYIGDAAKRLGIVHRTRFSPIEGTNTGWVYVRVTEEGK